MKGFAFSVVFLINLHLISCTEFENIRHEDELLSFSGKVKCEIKLTLDGQDHMFSEKDIMGGEGKFVYSEPWITANFVQGTKHLTIAVRISGGENNKIVIADAYSDFSPDSTKGVYTRFVKGFDKIEHSVEEIHEKSKNLELELEPQGKKGEIVKPEGKMTIKVTELKINNFSLKPGKKTMDAHVEDKS